MSRALLRECLDLVDRLRELRAPRDIEEGALMLNTCDYYALDDLAAALRARLAEPQGKEQPCEQTETCILLMGHEGPCEDPIAVSAPAPAPSDEEVATDLLVTSTYCSQMHGEPLDDYVQRWVRAVRAAAARAVRCCACGGQPMTAPDWPALVAGAIHPVGCPASFALYATGRMFCRFCRVLMENGKPVRRGVTDEEVARALDISGVWASDVALRYEDKWRVALVRAVAAARERCEARAKEGT